LRAGMPPGSGGECKAVPSDGEGAAIVPGLVGRRAVVTGGAHGIGLATVRLLREAGAAVVAVDRDEAALHAACAGGVGIAVVGDLAADDTPDLARRIDAEHGPIDLIVNNVGITTAHGFLTLQRDDFDLVVATNLRGPWFFTRELVRALIDAQRHGAIVFVSSVHDAHIRTYPHYSATKAAVAMLVKELAVELGPFGIRANAVAPGWIRTEPHVDPQVVRALTDRIPVGRPGTADEVARMIAVLLSDELSGYVTGAHLVVDGGLSLHTWLREP
jgi:NAD(P)-dependent dehydrogenase (short-subunit alcohol dehydrogenase family)